MAKPRKMDPGVPWLRLIAGAVISIVVLIGVVAALDYGLDLSGDINRNGLSTRSMGGATHRASSMSTGMFGVMAIAGAAVLAMMAVAGLFMQGDGN